MHRTADRNNIRMVHRHCEHRREQDPESGKLDVELQYDNNGTWENGEGKTLDFQKAKGAKNEAILWEPGCTYELPQIKVVNKGNLALKYTVKVTGVEGDQKLNEVIDWTIDGVDVNQERHLTAGAESAALTLRGHMQESAGNEYQNLSIESVSITVYATQDTVESDSFDNQYDKDARVKADSETAIREAMKKAGSVITVTDEIKPSETLVADKKDITLNMNGKTIVNDTDLWEKGGAYNWSLVSAQNGSSLTIEGNGTFKAKENDCYAVDVQDGSTVTIKNGTFVGNIHAVYVQKELQLLRVVHTLYSRSSRMQTRQTNLY